MNKQDIIKKLQELPDGLPVIFRQENDSKTPVGYKIRKIEVSKAYKSFHGSYIKYDSLYDYNYIKGNSLVDVIWIE